MEINDNNIRTTTIQLKEKNLFDEKNNRKVQ